MTQSLQRGNNVTTVLKIDFSLLFTTGTECPWVLRKDICYKRK